MGERIGIFGGTFDPPHLGHLILASEARWQLSLARMLWVPAAQPPHKKPHDISSLSDRLAMVELVVAGEPEFEISRVDLDRPGPHYTLETVRLLRGQNPSAQLILLLGGDSVRDLPNWHRPADVVAACDGLGVMRRPGDDLNFSQLESALPSLIEKLSFIDAPLLEISSHEIRERARSGKPYRYYVPVAVSDYIRQHQLYQRS